MITLLISRVCFFSKLWLNEGEYVLDIMAQYIQHLPPISYSTCLQLWSFTWRQSCLLDKALDWDSGQLSYSMTFRYGISCICYLPLSELGCWELGRSLVSSDRAIPLFHWKPDIDTFPPPAFGNSHLFLNSISHQYFLPREEIVWKVQVETIFELGHFGKLFWKITQTFFGGGRSAQFKKWPTTDKEPLPHHCTIWSATRVACLTFSKAVQTCSCHLVHGLSFILLYYKTYEIIQTDCFTVEP